MAFTRRKVDSPAKKVKRLWKPVFFGVLLAGKPIVGFLKRWRIQHHNHEKLEQRKQFLKRALVICVAILCIAGLTAGVVKALISVRLLTLESFASFTTEPPPTDEHGFTNVLLLGQGNANHDGLDLTDTMIVASFDRRSKIATMLSVPRDLQIRSRFLKDTSVVDGRRVNSLYRDYKGYIYATNDISKAEASIEALHAVKDEIGSIVNLDIHHVVKINFQALVDTVDILEGVEIDVPYNIYDTTYPDENYGYQTFSIKKGLQTIDGETALKYARSRHTTSDFSRSARQQQLIAAMAKKAKEAGLVQSPSKLVQLYQSFQQNVEMTPTLPQALGMAYLARRIDDVEIISFQLNDNNGLYGVALSPAGLLYTPPRDQFDGAAVLLPVSIPEFPVTWRQVRTLSHFIFNERWLFVDTPSISVLNSDAISGSASRLGRELKKYGFSLDTVKNASLEDLERTLVVYTHPNHHEYAAFLADLLGATVTRKPNGLTEEEMNDITIVLGADYEFTHFQDLLED